jgi:hypothetical protein
LELPLSTSSDPIRVTLPISLTDRLHLDARAARALGEELSGSYSFAEPFPHIVIDDFLPADLAERIVAAFPREMGAGDTLFETGYAGHHKRQVFPGDCDGFTRDLFGFFNSAPVLQFLEGMTLVPKLVADPYFEGGGFHEIFTGGKLGIHADFRVHERLNLQRRLNMLIYLNKDWRAEWGGELELWDRGMKAKVRGVAPLFNRCVVFSTDADSYHGHPDPLACPPEVSRKSMALYYYTASERIVEEVPANSTMYRARPQDSAAIKAEARRLRTYNRLRDWLPPVVFRALVGARNAVRRG